MCFTFEIVGLRNNRNIIVKTCLKDLEGVRGIFLNKNIEKLNVLALLHETQRSILTAR